MRKSVFILIPVLLIFLFSCGNKEKTNGGISANDTVETNNPDTIKSIDNQANRLELGFEDSEIEIKDKIGSIDYLEQYAERDLLVYSLIKRMYKMISQDKIKKSDVIKLLKMRDSLVYSDLPNIIDTLEGDTSKINEQLSYFGLYYLYDEMFDESFLEYKQFLPATMQQFPEAQELINFKLNYYSMRMGEYMYGYADYLLAAIDNGLNIYKLGENTLLYDYLKNDFLSLFLAMVDIHKSEGMCISGDCQDDPFFGINCDIYNLFIEKHPASPISKAMQKIVQDKMSYINSADNYDCYAVVVDKSNDYVQAENKIFKYFLEGKDIPHLFYVNKTAYIIYRFYPSENEANATLDKIKQEFPSAEIKHFVYKDYQIQLLR